MPSEIIELPPSPTKFTPISNLLEAMRVTRVERSPYKVKGPELPIAIWEPQEGNGLIRVRVDMPGVNRVFVVGDESEGTITFKGFEQEITMHGIDDDNVAEICRVYDGILYFEPTRFPRLDFNYEFCDGVLSIDIISIHPGKDICVTLRPKRPTWFETEITKESAINPLVSAGLDRHSIYRFTDKSFVFAIDMPGIGELDTVNLNWLGNTINFYAQDKSTLKGSYYGETMDESSSQYEGCFKLNVHRFDLGNAQFQIVHGVLWIMVPRIIMPPVELLTLVEGPQEEKIYDQP